MAQAGQERADPELKRFPLTSLQIGDIQSYLHRGLYVLVNHQLQQLVYLVDNGPLDSKLQRSKSAQVWQRIVQQSRRSPFSNQSELGRARARSAVHRRASFDGNSSSAGGSPSSGSPLRQSSSPKRGARGKLPLGKLSTTIGDLLGELRERWANGLLGCVAFEVHWKDLLGINYLNQLQSDACLAVEASVVLKREFQDLAEALAFYMPNSAFLSKEEDPMTNGSFSRQRTLQIRRRRSSEGALATLDEDLLAVCRFKAARVSLEVNCGQGSLKPSQCDPADGLESKASADRSSGQGAKPSTSAACFDDSAVEPNINKSGQKKTGAATKASEPRLSSYRGTSRLAEAEGKYGGVRPPDEDFLADSSEGVCLERFYPARQCLWPCEGLGLCFEASFAVADEEFLTPRLCHGGGHWQTSLGEARVRESAGILEGPKWQRWSCDPDNWQVAETAEAPKSCAEEEFFDLEQSDHAITLRSATHSVGATLGHLKSPKMGLSFEGLKFDEVKVQAPPPAEVYTNLLVMMRFQDLLLPAELRQMVLRDPKLLTMLESGLPSWAMFLQSYPVARHLYRPSMRKLSGVLYFLISAITVLIGCYDLYKNLPFVKEALHRFFGPVAEWVEQWNVSVRLGYMGALLCLQNLQRAFQASQRVFKTLHYLGCLLARPIAEPAALLWTLLRPLLATLGGGGSWMLFSVGTALWNVGVGAYAAVALVLQPLVDLLLAIWHLVTEIVYPIWAALWAVLSVPVHVVVVLFKGMGSVAFGFSSGVYVVWESLRGVFSFLRMDASPAVAAIKVVQKASHSPSVWKSLYNGVYALWKDLFSKVFYAVRSIVNGFLAFSSALNCHRLSLYNWFVALLESWKRQLMPLIGALYHNLVEVPIVTSQEVSWQIGRAAHLPQGLFTRLRHRRINRVEVDGCVPEPIGQN